MAIQFKDGKILFSSTGKIAMDPACCCGCGCDPSTCESGGTMVICSVTFEVTFSDAITFYFGWDGSKSTKYETSGWSALDATYTYNRASDCSWTPDPVVFQPLSGQSISWTKYEYYSFDCPGTWTLVSSGSATPQYRTGVSPDQHALQFSISPDAATDLTIDDAGTESGNAICGSSSIAGTVGGLTVNSVECVGESTPMTGTATSHA